MNVWRLTGLIVAPFILWLAILSITPAWPHLWYEQECCNNTDCEALEPDRVKVSPQGYHLPNGQIVPFGEARVSGDNDYHWCRYVKTGDSSVIHPLDKKICFYAPAGGV